MNKYEFPQNHRNEYARGESEELCSMNGDSEFNVPRKGYGAERGRIGGGVHHYHRVTMALFSLDKISMHIVTASNRWLGTVQFKNTILNPLFWIRRLSLKS